MPKYLTLVAVGDRESRKTDLLTQYTYSDRRRKFSSGKSFVSNIQSLIVDHSEYLVQFMDIETDDDYKILRYRMYEEANCVLLCYSITKKETFENLSKKWVVEVRKVNPKAQFLLIGIGTEGERVFGNSVTWTEGEHFKLLIGARVFVECSVEKCIGIDDVFIEAIRSTYTV